MITCSIGLKSHMIGLVVKNEHKKMYVEMTLDHVLRYRYHCRPNTYLTRLGGPAPCLLKKKENLHFDLL